jgi:hypothetical protein
MDTPSEIWTRLKDTYGQNTPTSIYKDFKEVLSIHINPTQHPGPQVDKMAAALLRLAGAKVPIAKQLQAMILLAALPQKWETLVSVVTQSNDLEDLAFNDVRDAILAQYQTETARGKGSSKQHDANKLSAVKRKRGNPNFSNQEKGSQQQDGGKQKGKKRGSRGKGKGKQNEHSHVCEVASLPAPTTSTIAQISPAGLSKRIAKSSEPKTRSEGPYGSLNSALTLADRLGATPTIQTTKNLEQRILQQYEDGPWSKAECHIEEVADDDVDMSVAPPNVSNDTWDDKYTPASPEEEPLDWGSEAEYDECVNTSSPSSIVHCLTASHLAPRGRSWPLAGPSECALPSISLGSTSCEHNDNYAMCTRCKKGDEWLLDSGASAHFTFSLSDFSEYTKFKSDERTPVKTAAHTIYVEGKGAVLLRHEVHGRLVVTRLWPVLYIPSITSRILSMGEFLVQGLTVTGDA